MSIELFSYLDDLLLLQSGAADRHNHNGVLGAVREEFLKQILKERVTNIQIHTGEVTADVGDLGQQDIIVRRPGTLNTELGGHVRLPARDCSAVIEVKSNAKGTEITSFDKRATLIKNDSLSTLCGIVCYKLACRKETILRREGFIFDKDFEGFIKNNNIQAEYLGLDFILSLDDDEESKGDNLYSKAFFLKREADYDLFLQPPFTQYFLMEINKLVA